jgi:hypothetical protein
MDTLQHENRCDTFPYTYHERVLALVEAAEKIGAAGLVASIHLAHQMGTRERQGAVRHSDERSRACRCRKLKHGQDRLCWLMQQSAAKRSCIQCLQISRIEYIPLVIRTPLALEIDRRELTTRVRPFVETVTVWLQQRPVNPGSRGSGRERGFFAQARLKPISPRRHPV